jgi:hypothetical protein
LKLSIIARLPGGPPDAWNEDEPTDGVASEEVRSVAMGALPTIA